MGIIDPTKGERKLNRDKRMKNRVKRRNERTSTDIALTKRLKNLAQRCPGCMNAGCDICKPFYQERYLLQHTAEHNTSFAGKLIEAVQVDKQALLDEKKEQVLLRQAKKDPVYFSSLFPEQYVEYLMDGKLDDNENMKLGPLPSFDHTPEEEQLRIENAQLKAELSSTERQLAVLVKPPTWRTLLKEWFMYKVLKRPKPQPLYIGPYR